MKILLINPPQLEAINPSLPKIFQEKEDPMPPLGLMYVSSYLKNSAKEKHQIKILDCQLEKINHKHLKKIISEETPDIFGITATSFSLLAALRAAEIMREIRPETKIVLGGPHVHIYPAETLSLKEIDFIVLGEGEETFTEFVDNVDQPENFYKIKGFGFKKDGEVVINEQREPIKDLDTLPFPDRRFLPYEKYESVISRKTPITTMFSSRGCPFKCLFCNRPHLGKIFRARSAKNVVNEMEECAKIGIQEIFFYDDTFTVDRRRVVEICDEILKRKLNIGWDVRARVDTIDENLLVLMKKAGCQRIHYGVEAGTQKILNTLRKGITLEQVEKAFSLTRKIGIQTLGYFMIGSPGETKKEISDTVKFAKKINPDFVTFSITTPYPATDLYLLGLEKHLLPCDYWKKFAENPTLDFKPMVWEENLKKKELKKMLKRAYFSFYFRPGYILKTIKNIKSYKEFARKTIAGIKLLEN
ncbi:MAG: radical SAM protein [Candidatus Pacebacteria bacterium]|nr:radical SAM protein [Candidatus Paceibacterota bacterium]